MNTSASRPTPGSNVSWRTARRSASQAAISAPRSPTIPGCTPGSFPQVGPNFPPASLPETERLDLQGADQGPLRKPIRTWPYWLNERIEFGRACHRDASSGGAALPAEPRVQPPGEREGGDLRPGLRRVLDRRIEAHHLLRTLEKALRVEAALRQMVHRRPAERLLQLRRPPRRGGTQGQGRLLLGR